MQALGLVVAIALSICAVATSARADWNAGLGPFSLAGFHEGASFKRFRALDLALVRGFNVKSYTDERLSWDAVSLPMGIGLMSYGSDGEAKQQFDFASLPFLGGAFRIATDERKSCGRLLYLLSLCLAK